MDGKALLDALFGGKTDEEVQYHHLSSWTLLDSIDPEDPKYANLAEGCLGVAEMTEEVLHEREASRGKG
jgi:hypothetical protein